MMYRGTIRPTVTDPNHSPRVVTSRFPGLLVFELSSWKRVLVAVRVAVAAENLPAAHVIVTVATSMRVLPQGGVMLLVHRTPPARMLAYANRLSQFRHEVKWVYARACLGFVR